jgi:hypothetical protein
MRTLILRRVALVTMNPLEVSNLKHIQIAAEAKDRGAPFRTFFDNLHAYRVGGPYLSMNGRPVWLNSPCPRRHRDALLGAHFVSVGAMRVLAGLTEEPLIKDHATPVAVLRELLIEAGYRTVKEVEALVERFYRIGIITRSEDIRLIGLGLRSRMPNGWRAGDGPFARYEAVGITAQHVREDW